MLCDSEDEIPPLPSPVSLGVSGTKSQNMLYDSEDEISPLPSPVSISTISAAPLGNDMNEIIKSLIERTSKLEKSIDQLKEFKLEMETTMKHYPKNPPKESTVVPSYQSCSKVSPILAHNDMTESSLSPASLLPLPVGSQLPVTPSGPSKEDINSPLLSSVPSEVPSPVVSPTSPIVPQSPSVSEVLLPPDEVIRKYPKLLRDTKNMGRLAVRLAVESYFGATLLQKSTVYGCSSKTALPREKVLHLKAKLLNAFPQYLSSPVDFEPFWTKSVGAINHCAAKLRAKNPIVID